MPHTSVRTLRPAIGVLLGSRGKEPGRSDGSSATAREPYGKTPGLRDLCLAQRIGLASDARAPHWDARAPATEELR